MKTVDPVRGGGRARHVVAAHARVARQHAVSEVTSSGPRRSGPRATTTKLCAAVHSACGIVEVLTGEGSQLAFRRALATLRPPAKAIG
jgi:hypothetical protein